MIAKGRARGILVALVGAVAGMTVGRMVWPAHQPSERDRASTDGWLFSDEYDNADR